MFLKSGAVLGYSLPKTTPRAYGFDNANKNSSSNKISESANFNRTVISVFSFGKSEEAIANFYTSKDDPKKKLKLPEYNISIEAVDNKASVIKSATQKALIDCALTADPNSRNGKIP